MLVKKSIVEKWYQTDSWVFKNFSFLFTNPLWNKQIPQGFSVCPYFWLSLVSMFLFRPFVVWPVQYVFRPILTLLGGPAETIDRTLWNNLGKIVFGTSHYGRGLGFMGSAALLFLVVLGITCILFLGSKLLVFYPFITASTLGTFAFWSIVSFMSLFGIIIAHKKITNTDCKTLYYLYVWLGLFIIIAPFVIPTEIGQFFNHVFDFVFDFGAYSVAKIAAWLWIAIKFIGHCIWFGLTWAPSASLVIPWWGYLLIMSFVGWLVGKYMERFHFQETQTYRAQTTEEYWERNRSAWLSLFTRILISGKRWSDGYIFAGSYSKPDWNDGIFDSAAKNRACYYLRMTIYRRALEILYAAQLEQLKTSYPLVKSGQWSGFNKISTTGAKFSMINELMDGVTVPTLQFSDDCVYDAIEKAIEDPAIKRWIDEEIVAYNKEQEKLLEKKSAKKTSWSHVTCLRVTTALANGVKTTKTGIKTVCSQIATLAAYLWILIKAKKQGACPYFKFTDPTKKK